MSKSDHNIPFDFIKQPQFNYVGHKLYYACVCMHKYVIFQQFEQKSFKFKTAKRCLRNGFPLVKNYFSAWFTAYFYSCILRNSEGKIWTVHKFYDPAAIL